MIFFRIGKIRQNSSTAWLVSLIQNAKLPVNISLISKVCLRVVVEFAVQDQHLWLSRTFNNAQMKKKLSAYFSGQSKSN